MTKTLTKEQFDAICWLVDAVDGDGGFLDEVETNAVRMTKTGAISYDYGEYVKKKREILRQIVDLPLFEPLAIKGPVRL
jgi:hypothetical protein